jgi:glycosyltransferase involved in cell wall biosynthesis
MKILVVNNAAPFIRGGAEMLADELVRRLGAVPGVDAELLRIPFRWEPAERIVEEILIHRQLRLFNADRVIGLKFPAYLIPHSHKTLWILHQFRQAYDLHENGQSNIERDDRGAKIIDTVKRADQECFQSSRAIFTISPITHGRLKRFNNVDSQVLYHPLNDPELFSGGEYGDYLFAGGRVGWGKRQHLLVEAMRLSKSTPRLVIAGPPESSAYAEQLTSLVQRYDLGNRVDLKLGFYERSVIANWVNGALACVATPFDEDSLSYVAMEAFAAGKAVLTTDDAGGLLEIVMNNSTGIVTSADAQSIAAGLDRLSSNREQTRSLGRLANALWRKKSINWETTLERLLEATA